MVDPEEVQQEQVKEDPEGYTRTPWIFKEVRNARVKDKVRFIGIAVGTIIGLYFMYQWFGWFFFLGLVPAPAWYFWALRQIDRESYTLIEVRLTDDKKNGKIISHDTQTNIYQIPPDLWKEMKKVGNPYSPGQRIYVCDKIDLDKYIIHFPDDQRLSNMNFWTRLELWMKLKEEIPELEKELALYKYDADRTAHKIAFEILNEAGAFHRKRIEKKIPRIQFDKEVKEIERWTQ